MSRTILTLVFSIALTFMQPVIAQDLQAIARVNIAKSNITDRLLGGVAVKLSLSQAVPFRVFTLDEPRRLVIDFKEVDWSLFSAEEILNTEVVSDVRYGLFRPGWSRMVLDLVNPLAVEEIEMRNLVPRPVLWIRTDGTKRTKHRRLPPADANWVTGRSWSPSTPVMAASTQAH